MAATGQFRGRRLESVEPALLHAHILEPAQRALDALEALERRLDGPVRKSFDETVDHVAKFLALDTQGVELLVVGLRETIDAQLGQRTAVVGDARGYDAADARRGLCRMRRGCGECLPLLQRRAIPIALEHRGEPSGVFPTLLTQKGGHRLHRGLRGLAIRRGRGFSENENVQVAQVARHAAQPRQRLAKTLHARGREDVAGLAEQYPSAAHRHAEIVHVHGLVRPSDTVFIVAQHGEQEAQQASNRTVRGHVGRRLHRPLGRIFARLPRRECQQCVREAVRGRRQSLLGAPFRGLAGGLAVAGQRTNPDAAPYRGPGAAAHGPLFFDDQPRRRLPAAVEQAHHLPPCPHATDRDERQVFDQASQSRTEYTRLRGAGGCGSASGLGQRRCGVTGVQGEPRSRVAQRQAVQAELKMGGIVIRPRLAGWRVAVQHEGGGQRLKKRTAVPVPRRQELNVTWAVARHGNDRAIGNSFFSAGRGGQCPAVVAQPQR